MLEVIANHDYGKSRFLRGASVDETRIAEVEAAAQAEAQRLEREKERAELLTKRERQQTKQATHSTTDAKPCWGTKEARWDAMMELQRRNDKSREQGKDKKED